MAGPRSVFVATVGLVIRLMRARPTHYAAPVEERPWWEATVVYLLLVPAAMTWIVGVPLFVVYWTCGGGSVEEGCSSGQLLQSSTGSHAGLVRAAMVLYLVAVVGAVLAQVLLRRFHFVVTWSLAALTLVASITAYGILSGMIGTPWGRLVGW